MRFTVMLVVALMVSLFGVTSSLAADEVKKITVKVDGELVEFNAEPFLENGTTLVPFRTIFTKLGLTIGWDPATKTATGNKEGLSISLTIGSTTAVVNGEEQLLVVAPKVVADETFIPLRFVSENAQKEVSWDGVSKEVYIADADMQIANLFDKHYGYSAEENLDGVMSTIDPSSPVYEQTAALLNQTFTIFDFDYEYSYEIIDIQENTAIVQSSTTTIKVNGPETEDNTALSNNHLTKVKGQWKIFSTEVLRLDYILEEGTLDQGEVTISEANRTAILDVLNQSKLNFEEEETDAEMLLYSKDYPGLTEKMGQAEYVFSIFDFTLVHGEIEFLKASDEEARVYVRAIMKKESGPEFRDNISGSIETLKKNADGKWLFTKSEAVFIDFQLEEAVVK